MDANKCRSLYRASRNASRGKRSTITDHCTALQTLTTSSAVAVSQIGRATLRVIEYFAKSLKVTGNDTIQ